MSEMLSLSRAAKLVGVSRSELQKKMQLGELVTYDGMVSVSNLLANYPHAQLEDTAESRRVAHIKERAFGKRVMESALPEPEVLAARIADLGTTLARSQAQVKHFNALIGKLWDRLSDLENEPASPHAMLESLRKWLIQEVELAMEPGNLNPLQIKNNVLSVMSAQVTVLPSKHDFMLEGHDTILDAAMRSGVPLNYGCSGGNCGLCKARVVSGEVRQTRHHDFRISESEKSQGYVLLCSNTAVSDVVVEAEVAGSVQDIPFQQIEAQVKSIAPINDDIMLLHLQTPRVRRLRFLAGQSVTLRVGRAYSMVLPIASCPCDDRNILFHIPRKNGNLFSDFVFDQLRRNDVVEIEGPSGEFILHEKSIRPLYFIAFDNGFAPIKSLIEHALSLNVTAINLHWIGSHPHSIYLPKIAQAWRDALDNFSYDSYVAGFDLPSINPARRRALQGQLEAILSTVPDMLEGDIYIAGPEEAVAIAEQIFLSRGLPKTRVEVAALK